MTIAAGQEGFRVNGDVIVQGWHHVDKVVLTVPFKHLEDQLEHLPHVVTDFGGGQVVGQAEGLLVELHDGVGEDMVNSLEYHGFKLGMEFYMILHDGQDGLHGVQQSHRCDGLFVIV